MQLKPHIFREYDIRGVHQVDLDEEVAQLIGRSYATFFRNKGGTGKLMVGRDMRLSSPSLHGALVRGLLKGGMEVVDIGMVATPVQYFAIHHADAAGGIQVTGSHNPPDHNGFKISFGKATLHGHEIQEMLRIATAGKFAEGEGTLEHMDLTDAYLTALQARLRPLKRRLRVVVDGGNGMGGPYACRLLETLGCTVIRQFIEPDGTFPNHHADPTVEKNVEPLIARVRQEKADLGIAFDGDADRIGVVDNQGSILWGDKLMVLYSRSVLAEVPGAAIVGEVKCSQTLYDDIAKHGGRPIMWKAGHSLIKAKMKEVDAQLGGEMSGHIFFRHRFYGFDDAIYAAGRLVELMANDKRSLTEMLADVPVTYATAELRADCPEDLKFRLVAKCVEHFKKKHQVVDVDGVRVIFKDGWGLIRASNTQPILVLRFEAQSPERRDEIRAYMEGELATLRAQL
ncbi:MAG: phosphomannomutase/phosphoglucomutase [Deltaproteobacteria bacterium]|nr:phosphomannomutase/phosphoglucomutase [Deltaproteobacteria bacterium]